MSKLRYHPRPATHTQLRLKLPLPAASPFDGILGQVARSKIQKDTVACCLCVCGCEYVAIIHCHWQLVGQLLVPQLRRSPWRHHPAIVRFVLTVAQLRSFALLNFSIWAVLSFHRIFRIFVLHSVLCVLPALLCPAKDSGSQSGSEMIIAKVFV